LLWHHSIKGSKLVLEEEPAHEKVVGQPDLPKMEATVLLAVARQDGVTAAEIVEEINKSIPTIGKPLMNLGLVFLFCSNFTRKI
jgi:hypothetical protein